MPYKDPEKYRDNKRDYMSRRRLAEKALPTTDKVTSTLGSPPLGKGYNQAAATLPAKKIGAPANFVYMETNIGQIKLVDTILKLTMRQLEKPGYAFWYHQQNGHSQPLVICRNDQVRKVVKINIPDFILDNDWTKEDVQNLLLSLTKGGE